MIVVDTKILAYFYLPGEYSNEVDRLFERDNQWVSPYLWRSEFRNTLTGYLRKGKLQQSDAIAISDAAENQMQANEYFIPTDRVFKFVSKSKCSAYDCEYVALASDLNVPLLTYDKLIVREFPNIAYVPKKFLTQHLNYTSSV